MDLFIFLADAWGPTYGGINSFNYDLVKACANVTKDSKSTNICCVVPNLTPEEKTKMKKAGIIPITISNEAFSSPEAVKLIEDAIKKDNQLRPFFPRGFNIFCIGHDVYTGELSKQLATSCDGWNIVFHHMAYESYYLFKNRNTSDYRDKVNKQESILCAADLVCGVGPKLNDSAKDITRGEDSLVVEEVYPGIASFNAIPKPGKRFCPIVVGRVEKENQKIKQIQLAVDAFAKAISLDKDLRVIGSDARISVVGYDKDLTKNEVEQLQKNAASIAEQLCNVDPIPFMNNREDLGRILSRASVAMMLSFHEGFGLVGYEAIAAGVPLILSRNTGLFTFLEREGFLEWVYPVSIQGSPDDSGYSNTDIETVAKALREIKLKESEYKEKALKLREKLLNEKKYSWDEVARSFIKNVRKQFESELIKENTAFYRPEQITKTNKDVCGNNDKLKELELTPEAHVFAVSGKNALASLCLGVQRTFGEDYSILCYDVQPEQEFDSFYSDFIDDCRSSFGEENDHKGQDFAYVLGERLDKTILVLNSFAVDPHPQIYSLLDLLNKSKYDFYIFLVCETEFKLTIAPYTEKDALRRLKPIVSNRSIPSRLSKEETLLLKVLSFCGQTGYTKKLVSYIYNGIVQYHDYTGGVHFEETSREIEEKLLQEGLIEENSEFSYRNTRDYLIAAKNLESDLCDYALGISKIGKYYGRCYRWNRGRSPLLRWGYLSCSCFDFAAKLSEQIKSEIKSDYEAILIEMRKNAMDTSDYERYHKALRSFIEQYHEPENPWIWYNCIHCETLVCPNEKTLKDVEHVIKDVIPIIDENVTWRVALRIQFIRLFAEIEYELDRPDVLDNLAKRINELPSKEKVGIAWEQCLSTLIRIAIEKKQYSLAKNSLNEYRKVQENKLYEQMISEALEVELQIVQCRENNSIIPEETLSTMKNSFYTAQNILRDYRAQGWIAGLWGECLLLLGNKQGEVKLRKSLENRKMSKERTRSYRNWLQRISQYELGQKTREILRSELERVSGN